MARHPTWMGNLLLRDPEQGKVELLRVFRRNRGVVVYIARELGVSRWTIFSWIWKHSLWDELDAIRAQQPPDARERATRGNEDELIARARALLRSRHGDPR